MENGKYAKLKKRAMYALLAIVPATAGSVVSYIESKSASRDHADEANTDSTEDVLSSVAPSITELQNLFTEGQKEHITLSSELNKMRDAVIALSKEVQYCKAYVDFDSRGRYRVPDDVAAPPMAVARLEERPKTVMKSAKKPKAKLPDTAQQAQQYTKARIQMKCSADDPMCGSAALK